MKIRVEQHHIDNGRSGDAYDCPIARAIQEQTDGKLDVQVMYGGIRIGHKQYFTLYPAWNFLKRYDNWGRDYVKPFNFRTYNVTNCYIVFCALVASLSLWVLTIVL